VVVAVRTVPSLVRAVGVVLGQCTLTAVHRRADTHFCSVQDAASTRRSFRPAGRADSATLSRCHAVFPMRRKMARIALSPLRTSHDSRAVIIAVPVT
jgi:hypothetical protein